MTFKMANSQNLVGSPIFHGCPKKPATLQLSKCVKVVPTFLKIILNSQARAAVNTISRWGWMTGVSLQAWTQILPFNTTTRLVLK